MPAPLRPANPILEGDELERLFRARPGRLLRRVPGRETFLAGPGGGLDADDSPWIVKRFDAQRLRPGWRDRLEARRGSPARRERDHLVALSALGLDVPRALAMEERGPRSLVVLEHVAHEETLEERLGRAARRERRALARRIALAVARMHAAGWYHRDLYLCHWLVGDEQRLVLIDVGRARRGRPPRRRWLVKDLAALLSSTPEVLGARERRAFLLRYLRARGLPGAAVATRWARLVRRKAARIAAHRPRHGETSA